jgi:type I site-specific restriction endonuclease
MSGLLSWFGQMWYKPQAVADMSEGNSATEQELSSCQIFTDRLDQLGDELDKICEQIDFNLDQLWNCRQKQSASGSVGTEDQIFQRFQIASMNKGGAQALLKTAASRVRQVVEEIDSIGRTEQ